MDLLQKSQPLAPGYNSIMGPSNFPLKYLSLICRELDVNLEELFAKDPNSIPLKLVISNENFQALKRLGEMFKKAIASE